MSFRLGPWDSSFVVLSRDYSCDNRQFHNTTPEDLFADLFVQVFGVENARLLTPQFPIEDIYGGSRYIDLRSEPSTSESRSRLTE